MQSFMPDCKLIYWAFVAVAFKKGNIDDESKQNSSRSWGNMKLIECNNNNNNSNKYNDNNV